MYKDTIISNPRAKHAPSGFNPTWTAFTGNLTTQALKDKASDASPSGILNTCLPTPHNDYLDYKYSMKHKPINHITIKEEHLVAQRKIYQ
jgi:hypothetical protein